MEHNFIKNRDIVLFAFQPWDAELGNNFRDMAIVLSRENRVLYVNRAPDRASLWRKRLLPQQAKKNNTGSIQYSVQQIHPGLWVLETGTVVESINWLPPGRLYNLAARINGRRLARQINRAIRQLHLSAVILINDNDFLRGRYLRHDIGCETCIFYLRDFLLGVGYFRRHGPRLEAACLQAADLVVANSAYLAKYAARVNAAAFDIGQGCDFTYYLEPVECIPADMQHINKPVIGYAGYVSAWRIDLEIIQFLARELPDCSIVLVGPVDQLLDAAALKRLPNVHFLGSKPAALMPRCISCFDVCINPQQLNAITQGNYPRKIDEYLVMGKPVVAIRTEAMEMFEPYAYLCTTKTAFAQQVQRILNDPEQLASGHEARKRKAFALTHTWTESIGKLGDAYFAVKKAAV